MHVIDTAIAEVKILQPCLFGDARGFFMESYNQRVFNQLVGQNIEFVQDNHSRSDKNVLRGLHYQIQQPQGKLVRVVSGKIFDVAVDLRRSSATFAQHVTADLSAENRQQLWIPPGFAHGFIVLSDSAEVIYKTTDYYSPEHERTVRWDDPSLNIDWPVQTTPILSGKDKDGLLLSEAQVYQ